MSDHSNDELKARIAELEAALAARPAQVAVAAPPVSPHAGPFRPLCGVCGSAHQPGQHSHCLRCKMPIGLVYPSDVETVPCEACGSRGAVPVPRVQPPVPIPRMPVFKVDK